MDGWIALALNITGIGAAATAPIAVAFRQNKTAAVAASMAIVYAILTIIGLICEWLGHYWDLESDLVIFGLLTLLTGFSGVACLRKIVQKKPN